MIPPRLTLQGLATTSLLVSLLIAIFLPLRPSLRRVVGSQSLCLLWLVLLIRLLMPWPMESRWSLLNRWQSQAEPSSATLESWIIKANGVENTALNSNPATTNAHSFQSSATSRPTLSYTDSLSILWLSGFVISLCLLACRCHQTRRLAMSTRNVTNERLLRIFSSIPQKWRCNVQLMMTDTLQVPTLAGAIHPQIWIPQSWLAQFTDDELRNVLLHELGHARRRDLLVQWLFAFARCVHWFNPLVWLAVRAACFDREMACDAWVLARNDADNTGYGEALLKTVHLLRDPFRAVPNTAAMASSRRNLFTRISGISAFQPVPVWRSLIGIAVMIVALAAATTSRIPAQETAKKGDKNTASQPPATPDSGAANPQVRPQANVEAKFVIITEDAWKKLCAENSEFTDLAGKFPELNHIKAPVADLAKGLNTLQKGAWEIPGEIQLLKSISDEQYQKMITSLNGTKGIKLLAAPRVTTQSGQRATVEVIREFVYPTAFIPDAQSPGGIDPTAFTTKNLGITLEVMPVVNKTGTIDAQLIPTVAGLLGSLQEKDGTRVIVSTFPPASGHKPVFSTSSGNISVNIPSSRCVLLGGVRIDNQATDSDDSTDINQVAGLGEIGMGVRKGGSTETVRHILLVFVKTNIGSKQ